MLLFGQTASGQEQTTPKPKGPCSAPAPGTTFAGTIVAHREVLSTKIVQSEDSADVPPQYLTRPPLTYPPEANHDRYEATVAVAAVVDTTGHVEAAEVAEIDLRPSGEYQPVDAQYRIEWAFRTEALRATRQLKFRPALKAGRPGDQLPQRFAFPSTSGFHIEIL